MKTEIEINIVNIKQIATITSGTNYLSALGEGMINLKIDGKDYLFYANELYDAIYKAQM